MASPVKNDAIIFIDANILLDFYRIRKTDISLKYLDGIERLSDRIITSSQVEMEYKKHRQNTIIEALDNIKTPDWGKLTPPALLSQAQPTKKIETLKKEVDTRQKQIRERAIKILKNPGTDDPVWKTLQRLFRKESKLNLDRNKKIRFTVRNLAKKRFILGYPPRKKDDTSIGDALHWEWIIHCAKDTGKDVLIVTRDSDFGCSYGNESYLNDWLKQEFKQRVSMRRGIFLTHKLSTALKLVDIPVTKEMEDEETRIIELDWLPDFLDSTRGMGDLINNAMPFEENYFNRVSRMKRLNQSRYSWMSGNKLPFDLPDGLFDILPTKDETKEED